MPLWTFCPISVNSHLIFQWLKLEKRQNNPKPWPALRPSSSIYCTSKCYSFWSRCRTQYVTLQHKDLGAMHRHLSPSCINALKRASCHVSVLWTSHLISPGFDLMPSLTSVYCLNDTILAQCASFLGPRTLSSLRSSTWDILPSLGLPCGPVYTAFKSLFKYVLLLNPNPNTNPMAKLKMSSCLLRHLRFFSSDSLFSIPLTNYSVICLLYSLCVFLSSNWEGKLHFHMF